MIMGNAADDDNVNADYDDDDYDDGANYGYDACDDDDYYGCNNDDDNYDDGG